MLQRGDQTPHFHVTTLDGRTVDYSTIWQHRNLVLVTVPGEDTESTRNYARRLLFSRLGSDTARVVTRDSVDGRPAPGVLVADRWGEIVYAATGANIESLPSVEEICDWLEYVQKQCPECEGEAR